MTKAQQKGASSATSNAKKKSSSEEETAQASSLFSIFDWSPMKAQILLFAISIAAFLSGIDGGLIYDDYHAILQNRDVREPVLNIWQLLTDDYWGSEMSHNISHKSYRPITVMSFRLNRIMHDIKPFGFHLVNIVLHAVVVVMFYRFLKKEIFSDFNGAAVLCSLLFAVHPIHTEAVSNVVGRAELLSSVFFLIGFHAYKSAMTEQVVSKWPLALSIIYALCAVLSKEQGITVVGLYIVYEIFNFNGNLNVFSRLRNIILHHRPSFIRILTLIVFVVAFLAFRVALMGGSPSFITRYQNPISRAPEFLTRVLSYNYIASFHGWLLLFPFTLCCDWSAGSISLIYSLKDIRIIAPILLYSVIGFLFFQFRLYLTFGDNINRKRVFFGLALLILPYLPSSNLFFPVGFTVAERILYLPSMGYVILFVLLLEWLEKRISSSILITLLFIILAAFTAKTVHRNSEWQSIESITIAGVNVNKNNAVLWSNLAHLQGTNGDLAAAFNSIQRAVELEPEMGIAQENYAVALLREKRLEEAEKHALISLQTHENIPASAYNTMAMIKQEQGNLEETEHYLLLAIDKDPQFIMALTNYAILLHKLEKFQKSREYYMKALAIDGNHRETLLNMGISYFTEQNDKLAEKHFRKFLEKFPNDAQGHFHLGFLFQRNSRFREAMVEYENVLSIDATHAWAQAELNHLRANFLQM